VERSRVHYQLKTFTSQLDNANQTGSHMARLMQDIDDHRLELDIFILLSRRPRDAGLGPTHTLLSVRHGEAMHCLFDEARMTDLEACGRTAQSLATGGLFRTAFLAFTARL